MRFAYADPPYPGRAHLYRDHPDYGGEVDHAELIGRLRREYDGWALSTSAAALVDVLPLAGPGVRVLAWVKDTLPYSWEPVLVASGRPVRPGVGPRDWLRCEPDAYQWRPRPATYVIGQKPEPFCRWVFHWLGAQPGDSLADLYPGSGSVSRAWETWSSQLQLPLATRDKRAATR